MIDLIVKDIGELSGTLLLFGGPYSNLQASKALLQKAEELGISRSNLICTGDLVAYCGNPSETARLMEESGVHIIQGNCEENLANELDDCGCGFEAGTTCAVLSDHWYNLARSKITARQKRWMGSLPHRLEFTFAGKRFYVLHGSNTDISEFVFPSTATDRKAAIINEIGCDVVIAGHSGFPFTQAIDDKLWHNPGVIGLPPNDGTRRVWYSLVKEEKGQILFEHHPLVYDADAASSTMKILGLTEYANALLSGHYPSVSVLPDLEQKQSGDAIKASSTLW